jgi:hypothetical protein
VARLSGALIGLVMSCIVVKVACSVINAGSLYQALSIGFLFHTVLKRVDFVGKPYLP